MLVSLVASVKLSPHCSDRDLVSSCLLTTCLVRLLPCYPLAQMSEHEHCLVLDFAR